jgi:hypothetical protein
MNIILLSEINNDTYQYLFTLLPISDKRSFHRTCIITYALSKFLPQIESTFQKMINDTRFMGKIYFSGFYFPLIKFTVELLFDGHVIPDKYIIPENYVFKYPKIFFHLAKQNNRTLIEQLNPFEISLDYLFKGAIYNMKLLKWCVKKYDIPESATASATKYNNFVALKFLIEKNPKVSEHTTTYAAKNGNILILKYLIDNGYPTEHVCYEAAYNGHFDIVKFCYSIGICDDNITLGAANGGHLDILKFGYEHGYKLNKICRGLHIHILEWLILNIYFDYNIDVTNFLAQNGKLDCLQFLHSRDYNILHEEVFTSAVLSRNIDMIKWLYDIGCPFDKKIINKTVTKFFNEFASSTPTVYQLLLSWGCEIDPRTCKKAARFGDIEILKIFYAYGCPPDDEIINKAALNGHLHVIVWALGHGCNWSTTTCENAAFGGHLKLLKWLRGVDRHDCDLIFDKHKICPWNSDIYIAAIFIGDLDILIFAHKHGCEFTRQCYEAAIISKNPEIIKYIEEKLYVHWLR